MELSKQQLRYFNLAKKLSYRSSHHQHHFGVIIVSKHNVVSVGFNTMKTHSKSKTQGNHLHGEISALLGTSFEETDGGSVYIYRRRKCGGTGLSRPCPTCMSALRLAGIKKVYFTTETGYQEERI